MAKFQGTRQTVSSTDNFNTPRRGWIVRTQCTGTAWLTARNAREAIEADFDRDAEFAAKYGRGRVYVRPTVEERTPGVFTIISGKDEWEAIATF